MLTKLKNRLQDIGVELNEVSAKAEDGTATPEDLENAKALMAEEKDVRAQIETLEAMAGREEQPEASSIVVKGPNADLDNYPLGVMLGDFVKEARGFKQPRVQAQQAKAYNDLKVHAAATGASEAVPADGGFLVGEDSTAGITERAYNSNELAKRADNWTLSTNANALTILANDETSRADGSRHGGIRHYWLAEAASATASKPTWRHAEMKLKKGAVLFYATDELIADAPLLERKVTEYVGDEMAFAVQDMMMNGDGAGKGMGILNGSCLVSVTAETGQDADTIVYENTVKMVAQFFGSDSKAIWIANRDTFPQLAVMNLAVGTGGAPVWIPANGAAGAPLNTLHGYPLIFIEQAATLGDAGDLTLCDWSQYYLAGKGGIQAAMSIHIEFVDDEIVFRWIHRIDGQPAWNSALTPYKGSNTVSPFVTIAARA